MKPEEKTKLISALTEFVEKRSPNNDSLVCTVKSIDTATYTCYCEPIGDFADIQQVKVKLAADKFGFFLVPKVDSMVIVSFTSDNSGFISMVTEIDDLVVYIDSNNKLEVDDTGFKFNDGTLDGMVKVNSLVTKLNAQENKLNALITAIATTFIPVPNDGGAALKALIAGLVPTTLAPTTPTVKADLENTKIKQ